MTKNIEVKKSILDSNFVEQNVHIAKDERRAIEKLADVKRFCKDAREAKLTQSETIDSLLIARFTLEMIADVLQTLRFFDTFDKAHKRAKRHANTFEIHYARKHRKHVAVYYANSDKTIE